MSDFVVTIIIVTETVLLGYAVYCVWWFRRRLRLATRAKAYLDKRAEDEPEPGAADIHALLTVAVQMGKHGYDHVHDLVRAKVTTEEGVYYGLEALNRIIDTYREVQILRHELALMMDAEREGEA